jgi:hypothetical protein
MHEAWVPRALRLADAPFGWYYYAWTAVTKRRIVTGRSEIRTFRRLLSATLARSAATSFHPRGRECGPPRSARGQSPLSAFCQRYARLVSNSSMRRGLLFRPHARVLVVQQEKWFLFWSLHPLDSHLRPRGRSRSSRVEYRRDLPTPQEHPRRSSPVVSFRTLSRRPQQLRLQMQAYRASFD